MSKLIRELEELSFRTLPALEQERYDGWVLRWSDGGSRRGNSANPVGRSLLPLDQKVAHCEQWFATRGAACIFRLTPLTDPDLDGLLADRAYMPASPTDVLTLPIPPGLTVEPSVQIAERPSRGWLRMAAGTQASDAELSRLEAQLMGAEGRRRFATIPGETPEAAPIAIGLGIDLDRYTTIYNMRVADSQRRRRLGIGLLGTLLALGAESGSTHGVLQVTKDNVPAQSLYRREGFDSAYGYRYMIAGTSRPPVT